MHRPTYQMFAELLQYPEEDVGGKLARCQEALDRDFPEERPDFGRFSDFVRRTPLADLQELYTRTFEIQPICHLDVGYVLFGEDYKRGEFLVHMNREHKDLEISCGTELPDHLTNCLKLLARHRDEGFLREFHENFLSPALEKMLLGFREQGNVYAEPLRALKNCLSRDFGPVPEKGGVS